jgi:mono/diheme cytochrome c family protein
MPATPKLAVTFIDDGGLAVLPDGAIIYVLFSARPCPSDNGLTYENFGAAFFASYCQRCHSATKQGSDRNDAPSDLNFDDLPSIRALAPKIWGQAGDSNITMPAGAPKPMPDERVKLGEWLACGAPGASSGADAASKP